MTFITQPSGALIQDQRTGQVFGYSPLLRYYQYTKNNLDEDGCLRIDGVVASWPSGAETKTDNPLIMCNNNSSYVIKRPAGAPGLNLDIQNAGQMQEKRAEQQQLEIERKRMQLQQYENMQRSTAGTIFSPSTTTTPSAMSIMNCGMRPIPPIGYRVGQCVNGQWQMISE